MILRNRNTSLPERHNRLHTGPSLLMAAMILGGAAVAGGGIYIRTSFPLSYDGIADSNLTIMPGGIGLAVEREATLKFSGDQLPTSADQKTYYPDVVSAGIDTFSFFFVDTNDGGVFMQGFRLSPSGGLLPGSSVKACEISSPKDCYLHVDQGENGFCLSFVQRGSGNKRYLRLQSATSAWNIDSAPSTGWLFPSQCRMRGDTFLVVASVDMNRVTLRKIYVRSDIMSIKAAATVFSGSATPGNALMNCSVAADSTGTICVAALRGSPGGDKYLLYQFFGSDLSPGPSGSYPYPVGSADFYYYDDVSTVSYGPGMFAIASWDNTGVLLHRLSVNEGTMEATVERIITATNVYACAAAANSKYLIVACIGDADGNGTAGVEGLEYPLYDHALGTPSVISFSDPTTAVQIADRYSATLNTAIDDSGNIALTWRNNERVAGCIWSHRGVRFRRGFYTSPVESLEVEGGDSVRFFPANVSLSSNSSWYTEESIRFGATRSACIAAPWRSISSADAPGGLLTSGRYFQFRVTINRSSASTADSLTTPSLTGVSIPWNARPRLVAIDSVKIGEVTNRTVSFGDTLETISRIDSVRIFLRACDADATGTLTIGAGLGASPQTPVASGGPYYHASTIIAPLSCADTVYSCPFTVRDEQGWEQSGAALYFRTRNSLPRLGLRLIHSRNDTAADTSTVGGDTTIVMQEEDRLALMYEVSDTNDVSSVRGYIIRRQGERAVLLDSTMSTSGSEFTMIADTVKPVDTVRLEASARDPDTVVTMRVDVVVNHRPKIRSLVRGEDTIAPGDTLNVVIDDTDYVTLSVDDPDCAWWDTLIYRYGLPTCTDSLYTASTTARLLVLARYGDTAATFVVIDRFGRSDSMTVFLAYPHYETDSAANPGYVSARKALVDSVSLIDGSSVGDTVIMPLMNSGRNGLKMTGCSFTQWSADWLRVVIDRKGSPFDVSASDFDFPRPVVIDAGKTVELAFIFSSQNLHGDAVICDTVTIFTDDPRHTRDIFPVCLEHNDLPFIVSVNPDFIADRPYRKLSKRAGYVFPPHAAIAIAFSEPMDSASATDAVSLYSVYDARAAGRVEPIGLVHTWTQNHTVLRLTPRYDSESPAFNLRPPPGLFIPTDSLILSIKNSLHDRAATPGGPNALDLNRDLIRDVDTDTAVGMRVDSINFTVLEISPQPGCSDLPRRPSVTMTFSSPVYAGSIDTSLENNRSFFITSVYNGGEPLPFESISVDSTEVVFTVGRELFYRDSLRCFFRSRYFCNRLGFCADNNGDGVDAAMFDTSSAEDDLEWGYRVKSIGVASVEPAAGSVISEASPLVVIRFDDRIAPGAVDTDTSIYNRSFVVGSSRTGPSPFSFVRLSADGASVELQPRITFFGNDSIYCIFRGFSPVFRYDNPINLPDSTHTPFGGHEWSFRSDKIGFYTFPNPYKPGVDRRHCRDGGPCGVWFKNLHTLADGVSEVYICIFGMTAHPLFDSRKKGEQIRFGKTEGGALPQWLWDTRNNRGELVGSGIYLYAVYAPDGRVLRKGKLIIVR